MKYYNKYNTLFYVFKINPFVKRMCVFVIVFDKT